MHTSHQAFSLLQLAGFEVKTLIYSRCEKVVRFLSQFGIANWRKMVARYLQDDQLFSGEQKQRIIIARALYKQPLVLVLEEATSHLDVNKERSVSFAISSLKITRLTIAHRPETIVMADRIIPLDASIHRERQAGSECPA